MAVGAGQRHAAAADQPGRGETAGAYRGPARPRPPGWRARLRALLRRGLGDALDKLPAQLSGGMRQRAAIVRAFGLRPDVLLMDEPFSALDEFTRESLQDQLLDLWGEQSATVLFVTHNIAEAVRLSDTVIVMAASPGHRRGGHIGLPRPRGPQVFAERGFHWHEDLIREKLRGAWRSPDAA